MWKSFKLLKIIMNFLLDGQLDVVGSEYEGAGECSHCNCSSVRSPYRCCSPAKSPSNGPEQHLQSATSPSYIELNPPPEKLPGTWLAGTCYAMQVRLVQRDDSTFILHPQRCPTLRKNHGNQTPYPRKESKPIQLHILMQPPLAECRVPNPLPNYRVALLPCASLVLISFFVLSPKAFSSPLLFLVLTPRHEDCMSPIVLTTLSSASSLTASSVRSTLIVTTSVSSDLGRSRTSNWL